MLTVTLVNPPCATHAERHWANFLPLGLGYLAAALSAAGHRVSVVDGKLDGLTLEETVARVLAGSPNLVGVTAMTAEFPLVMTLARRLKEETGFTVIVGGAHANAMGGDLLRECDAIDFCCVGEGERLITELADCLASGDAPDSIPGLILRRGSEIVTVVPRPYLTNLDALPFPAWHLFPKTERMPILTHRGCPFHCIFCSHNSGTIPRYRTVRNTLDELENIVGQYAPKVIHFEDETFGIDLERTKEILRGIIHHGLHRKVSFHAQTRVDRLDDEFLTLYREANFIFLELGVESGNAEVLKNIKKGITLDQVEIAVALARKHGVKIWCKFILGHPHETVDNLNDTVRLISKLNPDRLSVSVMTPYPGTPIHRMASEGRGGYRLLSQKWTSFDKYSGATLELETVPLSLIKWLQIWCFLRLYLVNGRMIDLARFAFQHHVLAFQMITGLLKQILFETGIKARTLRRR